MDEKPSITEGRGHKTIPDASHHFQQSQITLISVQKPLLILSKTPMHKDLVL